MSGEYSRIKCPKCGESNPRMMHEVDNKSKVLYYSMQGTPVYAKQIKCGDCGHIFDKP